MKAISPSVPVYWFLLTLLAPVGAAAQSNVRAWSTNGQVFVVWTTNAVATETYAIYTFTNAPPFTNTSQGTLVGRLFHPEWSADNLLRQVRVAYGSQVISNYVVPGPTGSPSELQPDEGLFVDTVRSGDARLYAVLPFGQTNITAARRSNPVTPIFTTNDSPRPHLQVRAPGTTGHIISMYLLFVDGDLDMSPGRPDFPVFANQHKRGSPHLFLTVEPLNGLPGDGPWPATMGFHGSNGDATLWLPSNEGPRSINVVPTDGYVVAFDDELYSLLNGVPFPYNTRWIGYVPSFNPFTNVVMNPAADPDGALTGDFSAFNPPPTETIVNYTQRRILWIVDWLIATSNIDSNRVALIGHSAGSMGAQSLTRAYPERFSSVQLFNCGMRYFIGPVHAARQGDASLNLPVTLTNHLNQSVRLLDLLYFTNRVAAARDLPFMRHWHGKCDNNGAMLWRGDMIDQMRFCDSEGWGLHFYWDLRRHGTSSWRDYWVDATSPATLVNQTQRDDVRNQSRYRRNQAYPAFFNLQRYANHGDPGPGYIGGNTTNSPCGPALDTNGAPVWNGDDHGTWGGYFDWETDTLVDTPTNWQCTVFATGAGSGYAAVDASPIPFLSADIAVRRPQAFLPLAGTMVQWMARRVSNNAIVGSGSTIVNGDDLVIVTNLNIPRDPERLRLILVAPDVAIGDGLQLLVEGVTGGQMELRATGQAGQTFALETSTNLVDWSWVSDHVLTTNSLDLMPAFDPTELQRFFRLRETTPR